MSQKSQKNKNKSFWLILCLRRVLLEIPKGVKISHENLIYLIKWIKNILKLKKRCIFKFKPSPFDNSLVFDIYGSIFNGLPIVPINKHEFFDGKT